MNEINIVGGGIAGLVAANVCAEAGAQVTLREAHHSLGGRGRTTAAPYIAHDGTHVFYCDGSHWRWLTERGLVGPAARVSWREIKGVRLRREGVLRVAPPAGLARMVADRRRTAPVESKADGLQRLERLVELGIPGWRRRTTWRRDAIATGRTGALDLPGRTWRDRPAINRGDGVFLAGDMVAAPGLLGEVSINSAIEAARGAVHATGIREDRASQGMPASRAVPGATIHSLSRRGHRL
ncbi:MAG: hypothetical protein DLM61_17410 [Pseudonocardiales bacterium]|nr:MAG: hypothetical protein DLM61_17410 [Pseudonocardiales bacterium]